MYAVRFPCKYGASASPKLTVMCMHKCMASKSYRKWEIRARTNQDSKYMSARVGYIGSSGSEKTTTRKCGFDRRINSEVLKYMLCVCVCRAGQGIFETSNAVVAFDCRFERQKLFRRARIKSHSPETGTPQSRLTIVSQLQSTTCRPGRSRRHTFSPRRCDALDAFVCGVLDRHG